MTGKTTYLSKQIEHAAEKHGSENVVVASYTKAAATVLNRRQLPIPAKISVRSMRFVIAD